MSQQHTNSWNEIITTSVSFRRELHRYPELGWSEVETAERIRQRLTALGIQWRECADTGTIAVLASDKPGPHIALRADIDALPIIEKSGVDWTSEHDGCMHACGHDGHTATLYNTAQWLKRYESELPGPVTLLFQPAEEGGHGAKRMIEDGALEGVKAIYGWHNWPAIPLGQVVCPDAAVMAGNGTFQLTVQGAGGHSSQPELCRDPVLAGSAIVLALQQLVSRRLPAQSATVISVTSFDAKSGVTVIPEKAILEGSYRLTDPDDRPLIDRLIKEIAESTAQAYGTTCMVEVHPRYQPTINHATEAEKFREALVDEFGSGTFDNTIRVPIMASEDFSYYLNEIPGAFALIGSGTDEIRHNVPCHSPKYDFNDALIPHVTRILARLAGAPLPD
ncbi:N(2)-acetyl-L-2,4-diaminobutanoate deacetylase DoeB2 [Hahella ganghwensis]|uniref:N(2)-acetyl-L-2,4-diaminobutanoate deacetylase DoeB2 n=1 Tax=Hahella ganghwensis TaxID=286420 RepID=UPI000362B0FD|nr:N(2)-acetyl-L-2,4-diaminobutanoate deacetylase DoeB2 [Hahella ganghwensis]